MLNGAAPPFDLAEGGLLLAFVRSLSVIALFSMYGALLFRVVVAPYAFDRMGPELVIRVDRQLRHLIWVSLAIEAVALNVWLAIEAGVFAEAPSLRASLAAVVPVLSKTAFGHVILMQLATLSATFVALGRGAAMLRWRLAAGVAMLATLLHAGHSHALAMAPGPSLLLVSDGLHLLCAGAWLGGLLPLLLVIRAAPPQAGATAARYFSPLGKLCLYGLVVSAGYQGWSLLGGVAGVLGTAYGWMAMVKASLFAVLFGFAWVNRYWLAPALLCGNADMAKRTLVRSIALQTGFGIAIVIAAGLLSSLPPGLHTQPVWPFREQISLVTIQEDPDFRREVIMAVFALAAAIVMLAFGIVIRRFVWPAAVLALLLAGVATPHLSLLFVAAYPTSFYGSPTGFAATAIVQGRVLYPTHCAACHGAEGRGDGPDAKGLSEPPADLTAGHLWGHSDGELFWWLSHGIDAPNGGLAMPGFAVSLSDDQRWDLIDYIRARNAGLEHAATGIWVPHIHAPDLTASCQGGRRMTLADFRGEVLRVVFGAANSAPPLPPQPGIAVATITIPAEAASMTPSSESCVATDPSVRAAYGIISGVSPAQLGGAQFLVDPNGWLRMMQPAGTDRSFAADQDALLVEIERIYRHPLESKGGGAHRHPS